MPLTNSNTYIEPTAGTSLNAARSQFNDSLHAVLSNFKSEAVPTGVNLTTGGVAIGEVDGMLYRSASTNALYISDSIHVKSSPVGGNFTRVGIGNRVENGVVALGANATSYEIGELVATVSETPGLTSNARLYLCISNTMTANSTVGFLDVGAPLGYSIGTNDNVSFSGQSVSAIRFLATANVGIGITAPAAALHVVGNAIISSNSFIRIPIGTTTQRPSIPATGMLRYNSTNAEVEVYSTGSWNSVGGGTLKINNVPVNATAAEVNYIVGATSNVQAQLNSKVKADADDSLLGGYNTTADNDGTFSSGTYTPTFLGGNMKRIINGGAFTLAAPTATGDFTLIIQITNNATAGVITLSGFTVSTGVFTTTNGDNFFAYITKLNNFTSINIEALQ